MVRPLERPGQGPEIAGLCSVFSLQGSKSSLVCKGFWCHGPGLSLESDRPDSQGDHGGVQTKSRGRFEQQRGKNLARHVGDRRDLADGLGMCCLEDHCQVTLVSRNLVLPYRANAFRLGTELFQDSSHPNRLIAASQRCSVCRSFPV